MFWQLISRLCEAMQFFLFMQFIPNKGDGENIASSYELYDLKE